MNRYDLAIIGAGPGGYHAAIRAAQLGKNAVIIEQGDIGGVCLNRGCIPTKSFAASAHVFSLVNKAESFGIELEKSGRINFGVVQKRKQEIVTKLKNGIDGLLKAYKIKVINGKATLKDKNTISVSGEEINADNIIIATGSEWINLPNLSTDGEKIVTSDEALEWNELPESVAIIGGGYIGCEFASLMNRFGVDVTIIELTDSLLPNLDTQITRLASREFKKKGIKIFTKTTVNQINHVGNKVELVLSGENMFQVEKVLVAVGRKANSKQLNLESLGVSLGKKEEILVNESFQTNISGIYAVGDVNGRIMLAHAASEQAIACVNGIFGAKVSYNEIVPSCTFTCPEIGSVGLTEKEIQTKGIKYKTGKFAFAALGKAIVDGAPEGQVIVYAGQDNEILGVHVIGKDASAIIAEAALAINNGLTTYDVAETIHAHPTTPEALLEAMRDVNGEAINRKSG